MREHDHHWDERANRRAARAAHALRALIGGLGITTHGGDVVLTPAAVERIVRRIDEAEYAAARLRRWT